MRIHLPLPPTCKLQMLRNGAAESSLGAVTRNTTVLCWTNHLHQWPMPPPRHPFSLLSHLHPECLAGLWAPDLTPQNLVRCDRAAPLLPTICSKCVEPSVSKTGRARFPFSPGFVSLFSGASLLPVWLLGLGSGPTKGFLKWRSWGWGCRAHLLQAWGPSIINGATSIGDSSDMQPWPEERFWTRLPLLAKKKRWGGV